MHDTAQIDIKKYWRLIVFKRYLFIAVALGCLSIIVWGSYFRPKVYEAKSTVLIERNVLDRIVKDLAQTPSIESRISILTQTITSRQILMKLIDELDLNKDNQAQVEKRVSDFQKNTQIKMGYKSQGLADYFTVSYRDSNPEFARNYVNTLIRLYVEENLSSKREESSEANKFLAEQLKFFKEKMEAADAKIIEFRKNKDIFIAVNEAAIVLQIKGAEENLESINIQRMELEAKKNITQKQFKGENPYTVAMFGKTKGGSLNDRLLSLQNKLNDLLVRYTENYPDVIKTKAEIEILEKQIQDKPSDEESSQGNETEMTTLNPIHQKLKEDLGKIDLDLAALSARERHSRALIASKKEYLKHIPLEKKNLAELESERSNYQKIYEEIVVKLGQSEVSKQIEIQDKANTFRVLDPAILPTKPVSPNMVVIILFGFVAGIAAGFGTILLLDNIDHSVKTVDDIKKYFGTPVLAVIPQIVTEGEINKSRKMDRKVYAISLAYISIIGLLFIKEAIAMFL
jgi:polysaccharide chain length determinant protein (PEP-CTERM system associated)